MNIKIALSKGSKRQQHFLLLSCPYHRTMGSVQIMKMLQKTLYIILCTRLLQHILAHEAGEGIHLLHGNSLLEKIHGLQGADAKATAKILSIFWVIIINMDIDIIAEALSQASDVTAKIAEVIFNGKSLFTQHKEPLRASRFILVPENLSQSHSGSQIFVTKNSQYNAVLVSVTKGLWLANAILGPLLGIIAPYIRIKAALSGTGIRRLVVGNLFRWNQQSNQCIHQSRFAGAYITCQK